MSNSDVDPSLDNSSQKDIDSRSISEGLHVEKNLLSNNKVSKGVCLKLGTRIKVEFKGIDYNPIAPPEFIDLDTASLHRLNCIKHLRHPNRVYECECYLCNLLTSFSPTLCTAEINSVSRSFLFHIE